MQNLCQTSFAKTKKVCTFTLVLCLMWGGAPAAESISVKLRGKIALAGILSGLAYTTHTLIKRDRRAVEKLQRHLGPPERVIQFERGFDVWRVNYYRERCYIFRNNRFIKSTSCADLQSGDQANPFGKTCGCKSTPPFLIDTPVLGFPKWSSLCLSHLQRAPQLVFFGLCRLGAERSLGLVPWLSD